MSIDELKSRIKKLHASADQINSLGEAQDAVRELAWINLRILELFEKATKT